MKIRIFTDGGSFPKEDEKFTAVSSFRIFNEYTLLHAETEIHEDKTNNFAEIHSIRKALENLKDYLKEAKPKEFEVELYSDSLLYVQSLTKWIFNWIKTAKDGVYYNSVGQKVANQEEIKEAFKIVVKLKGHIKIWHINSHVPKSKVKQAYKKFIKFNKCDITYEDFVFAYLQNKECDTAIKRAYDEYIKNKNEDNNKIEDNRG